MSEYDPELQREEGREDPKQRLEREYGELLQELRALIPGGTVLFGFLLAITFTDKFETLDRGEREVYYATLLSTAAALVLYLAPAAHHRLRFRGGDKANMLVKGNRETIAATVASALSFTGVIYLVTDLVYGAWQAIAVGFAFFVFTAWRWWAIALYRSVRDKRRR